MGRTVLSVTQVFLQEEASLQKFKYALRRQEQSIVDDLLVMARKHLSAVGYAGYALPAFLFLFSILVEQQKIIQKLQSDVESIKVTKNEQRDVSRLDP